MFKTRERIEQAEKRIIELYKAVKTLDKELAKTKKELVNHKYGENYINLTKAKDICGEETFYAIEYTYSGELKTINTGVECDTELTVDVTRNGESSAVFILGDSMYLLEKAKGTIHYIDEV